MPAHTSPPALLVTFHRAGEPREQQVALDGIRAVSTAMRMLALREELQHGDRLTVESAAAPSIVPA